MNRHPIFVYGTLRPGEGNARVWVDRAEARHDGTCFVLGRALVDSGGFPYLVPALTAQTVGALIVPADEHYDAVLDRMDDLEGYHPDSRHNHYERITIAVVTPDGPVRAWTYVPASRALDHVARLPDVATNEAGRYDWAAKPRRHLRAVR